MMQQPFAFALRQSTADSVDDSRSRYVPSSIYSGPGPMEESPLPPQPIYAQNRTTGTYKVDGSRNTYQSTGHSSYAQSGHNVRLRNSNVVNMNDPVVMHLLAETALSDSKDYEILSFEELEQMKRDRTTLRNRIEATKRKLALEYKLRDAARSLDRLYTKTTGSVDLDASPANGHNRNGVGSKASNNEALSRANEEYHASNDRIAAMTHELKSAESRLENMQRRLLEHTAGILQLTHRGLKKNLRKGELPRSPESMASRGHQSVPGANHIDDFDERSLYPVPDYVHEFALSNAATPVMPSSRGFEGDTQQLAELQNQVHDLGVRLHDMVRQLDPSDTAEPLPETSLRNGVSSATHVQEQLQYISRNMDMLAMTQQRMLQESENVHARIQKMLDKTKSVSRGPIIDQNEPRGGDLVSQLVFSTRVLEQLHTRVETLVEQKDILTRQIQQQRELNTKSDAQRDAQIQDLTEELEETKRTQMAIEQEANESQTQISQLIEQLDRTKHEAMLVDQERGMSESKALQIERNERQAMEKDLLAQIATKQVAHTQLEADLAKIQSDFELRSQQHTRQLNEVSAAKEAATIDLQRYESEGEMMLEQMANLQTELTIAKAELDSAYGSRAQRAADASLNPTVQREIDSLSSRNAQLQKELKDTIEDYEQMTKASIEFEKERDQFEASIDSLRAKCEHLESQLGEEKLKWLGMKTQAPSETTSTMVLKNEFKKMMRDTRAENTKALRAEQEERRRLEALIRHMRKEAGIATPAKSTTTSLLSPEPMTPSASR